MKRSIKPKSTSENYDISVIIVCRNGKEVTEKCLQGIERLKVKQIVVVDNNSSDGTTQLLDRKKKKDERYTIIRNKENNGFALANNQGIQVSSGSCILFLNNDTVITQDFLPPLISTLSSPNVAAVQPMILFPDKTIDSIGSYFTPTGFLYHRAHRMYPKKEFLKVEPVYSLKGACMLWKKSVLNEIGFLDESYFAYFEETELCHRAINAGYTVMVNPNGKITHLGGFTSNSMNQRVIQYYNSKNRVQTYLIHLTLPVLLSSFIFHFFLCELLVVKTLFSRMDIAVAIQKGLLHGFYEGITCRLKKFSKKRQSLQAVTKYPDISYYVALFTSLKGYQKIW